MFEVVGIRLRKIKDKNYFNPGGLNLHQGDRCIVETDTGYEEGTVVEEVKIIGKMDPPPKKVLRRITPEDLKKIANNRLAEKRARKIVLEKTKKHQLDLKLSTLEYTLNQEKLFVYYTAPERIDFRELVKDLAYTFKTRIEMRQIGTRDEAKMLGGFGTCGRELCCLSYLKSLKSISIEMAKEQGFSPTSSKISGPCGRLKCCLAYEYAFYRAENKKYPRIGTQVNTPDGEGKVVDLNILSQEIGVEYAVGSVKRWKREEISPLGFFERLKPRKEQK